MDEWMSEMTDNTSTPEPSTLPRRCDDSGYLSATPDSLRFTRDSWRAPRLERLPTDTPNASGKNKCPKQPPFPMSTEECVDLNDVEMIDVDDRHDIDMDDDACLDASDHAYNDHQLELKFGSASLTLCSPTGLAELKSRLESVAHGPTYRNWRRRLPADLSDRPTVDFLSYLGEKSDHSVVVSRILGYLSPEELRCARDVSCCWRRVVLGDKPSRLRLKQANRRVATLDKENAATGKGMKVTPVQHAGRLINIANLEREARTTSLVPVSPPVSPGKIRFHKFVKAGRSLKPGDVQTTCPRCNGPSQVASDSHAGRCLGPGCRHEFCARCRRPVHSSRDTCLLISSPRGKKRYNPMSVGSMQSRRNLKRL